MTLGLMAESAEIDGRLQEIVGGANEADPNGATPLDYAVYLGTAEMATVVAQNGGFLTGNFSGIQDQYDLKVPIHRAFGNYHVVTKSLDYHQVTRPR
ncbi:unnamed protein product [Cyprideis torosa]|uniref:Uncharacterized protein n=1 Tax=Cyprideis torosa TaxID=163714 RepID=A0A7R8ZNN4_9CRUS|nr:unnamed protein product [Cyprideis torosa]CAG0898409.1 unnamed protein product [Cyprideis torosa]